MKLLLLVMLGLGVAWGQSATPPSSTSPIPTITSATTFVAGGVSLLPQTSPKPTGWAVVATTISASQQIYSFSETDYAVVGGKVATSARTGLATFLRKWGTVSIYGLADAGIATTGSATGIAYAGGGFARIPFNTTGWDVIIGVRELHTTVGRNTTVIEVGVGKKIK